MTRRRINSLLYAGAVALCVAAIAVVVASFMPLDAAARPARASNVAPALATTQVSNDPVDGAMLAALEPALSRPLRGKPAPVALAAPTSRIAAPPAAAPGLILVGTIGDSTAMIRTADGNIVARSVGQRIGDAEVVSVRGGQVQLRYSGGRTQTLRKASTEPVTP